MFGNYRDYQLDHANRRAAQAAEGKMMDAQHMAAARANQASREFRQSYGDPRATQSQHDNLIAQATSPYQSAMGQHEMAMRHAMQNAMSNEMAQVQDRSADMQENVIAGKRASDQMKYLSEINKQKTLARMMSGLGGSGGVGSIDATIPDVNIYSSGGKRIGGSSIGKSLLG